MKRALAFLPLIALLAIVIIAGVLLLRGGQQPTFSAGLIGRPAPAFSLARLDGQGDLTNSDMAGHAYVINMFASWCTPCRAEHPMLMQMRENGIEIVGIAYKDRPDASRAFLDRLGNPYRAVASDPDGRFGLELGIIGVPETFVVGPDGAIRAVFRGPLTTEVIERQIVPALER